MPEMKDLLFFINKYKVFSILMFLTNITFSVLLMQKLDVITNKSTNEAMGRRMIEKSLYKRCVFAIARYFEDNERRHKKTSLYLKAKIKAKKLGFKGEYPEFIYLFIRYGISVLIFIIAFIINFPSIEEAFKASILVFVIIVFNLRRKEKLLNLALQKYVYKIYKYLHNQIISGIKVTDAIKNVYEVIDDKRLKHALIRMAARYELTMDVDAALNELRAVYDNHEAESFCVAIKQGILTGDNSELLARQEDIMFKKYFNYIQSETDSCKTRSLAAAVVFIAIIVIMILIPILFEAAGAMGKIFES